MSSELIKIPYNDDLMVAVHSIAIPLAFAFGIYSIIYSYNDKKARDADLAYFLTARKSQPIRKITLSFIATMLGSWVYVTPPTFAISYGYLGIIAVTMTNFFVMWIPGFLGPVIQKYAKDALSINDYCRIRYGKVCEIFIVAICIFNLGINMLGEMTILGQLFEYIVGGSRLFILIYISVVTSIYTSIGGLTASIATDAVQAVFSIVLTIFFLFYVIANFRIDTTQPLAPTLDANPDGYGTLCSYPLSISGFVIFSESFWQKSWAADDSKNLKVASIISSITISCIVFFYGIIGFCLGWDNKYTEIYNLQLFGMFADNQPTWILVFLMVLSIIMSESAIDSYQIALTSNISTCFLKGKSLWYTRMVLVLINAPLIYASFQDFNLNGLYLIQGLACVATIAPILLGMVKCLEPYHGSINVIISTILGLFFTSWWGSVQKEDVGDGLTYIFYEYWGWQTFLIAFLTPIGRIIADFRYFFRFD